MGFIYKCPKCKAELNFKSNFCSNCGYEVSQLTNEQKNDNLLFGTETQNEKKEKDENYQKKNLNG